MMADYFVGKTEEEAIAKGVANGCVEFDGDEYCIGNCSWDGVDRRCACGNRRVCWSTYKEKEPDGNWVAYGEAW